MFYNWVNSRTVTGTTSGGHLGPSSSRGEVVSCGMGMWYECDGEQQRCLGQHGRKGAYPVGIRGHRFLSPNMCPQSQRWLQLCYPALSSRHCSYEQWLWKKLFLCHVTVYNSKTSQHFEKFVDHHLGIVKSQLENPPLYLSILPSLSLSRALWDWWARLCPTTVLNLEVDGRGVEDYNGEFGVIRS